MLKRFAIVTALLFGGCGALLAQAITGTVSPSAEATRVISTAAARLVGAYATNTTGTDGYLLVLNLTSAPADGAVTPRDCVRLPANGSASIFYANRPKAYNTGITIVLSSASTCFTKTTGTITGFISGMAD